MSSRAVPIKAKRAGSSGIKISFSLGVYSALPNRSKMVE
jgi:hypothetical protein